MVKRRNCHTNDYSNVNLRSFVNLRGSTSQLRIKGQSGIHFFKLHKTNMKTTSAYIVAALMALFITTALSQNTQQVFRVTRVFVNVNNAVVTGTEIRRRNIKQDGTAQVLQFYSRSCDNIFPTLTTLPRSSGTTTSSNSAATCSNLPLSLFVTPNAGDCSANSCSILTDNVGGALGGGFGPGQVAAPGSGSLPQVTNSSQYVSITTYTSIESTPGSATFPGQGATGTNIGVAYCPGSAAITSNFLFQAGACILSPNVTGVNTQGSGGGSIDIFSNYRAFYALCSPNNGLLIKGCADTSCQNCFVITDTAGCVQFTPSSLTGYINYQGCGLGRAAGTSSTGTNSTTV